MNWNRPENAEIKENKSEPIRLFWTIPEQTGRTRINIGKIRLHQKTLESSRTTWNKL
jgi:hypothetical protein